MVAARDPDRDNGSRGRSRCGTTKVRHNWRPTWGSKKVRAANGARRYVLHSAPPLVSRLPDLDTTLPVRYLRRTSGYESGDMDPSTVEQWDRNVTKRRPLIESIERDKQRLAEEIRILSRQVASASAEEQPNEGLKVCYRAARNKTSGWTSGSTNGVARVYGEGGVSVGREPMTDLARPPLQFAHRKISGSFRKYSRLPMTSFE